MKVPTRWGSFFSGLPSISYKIIIPYAMLTLTLAAVGIYVMTSLVAGSFQERFDNQLLEAGRIISGEIVNQESLRLKVSRDATNTQGVSEMVAKQDWDGLYNIIYPIMVNNVDIDSLIVVNKQGKEMLRFGRNATGDKITVFENRASGLDLMNWSSVSDVLSGKNLEKGVELASDSQSKQLIIYTIAPLRTPDGIGGAVLIGNYVEHEILLLREVAAADIILLGKPPTILGSTIRLTEADKTKFSALFTLDRYNLVLALANQKQTLFDDFEAEQQSYRLAYAPFLLNNKSYGVFAVALSTNFVTTTNNNSRTTLTVIFTIGVFIVFVVGWSISRQIIQPLKRLVQVTQAVARGDLKQRTELTSRDEVGVLAANFDHMTVKLEEKTNQLEEEASKLTAILSSIADGVIVQDATGGIISQNPAADNIIQAINKTLKDSSTEADPLQHLLTSLHDLAFLEQRRLEMGELVLSALSAPVIASNKEKLGSVVVLRDITKEVETERLKDKFIQGVSHELKTPMFPLTGAITLIKMMLPMIQSQIQPKMYDKLLHNANVADEQANDIKNVVMAMVDLSEIDANSFAINRTAMNLLELIELVTRDWYGPMEEKGLEFEVIVPEEPVWIDGDWEKLTHVLRALLKNSYNYTLEGRVELAVTCEAERVKVLVTDTGVGILEKDQPQLFTRFYRAIHDKKTFELSGIGLGLYLSKVILERQDGEIWMQESKEYGGSIFGFALPTIAAPEPSEDDDGWGDDDDWGDEAANNEEAADNEEATDNEETADNEESTDNEETVIYTT